jgi:hypothetical protein
MKRSSSLVPSKPFVLLTLALCVGSYASGQVATTTTLAAGPNPAVIGQIVTLTAAVTAASGSASPTGVVAFRVGSIAIGSATLSQGTATLSASTTSVGPGLYPVVATYGGSSGYASSASAAVSIGISNLILTSTQLAVTPNSATVGQPITLQATVSAGSGTRPASMAESFSGALPRIRSTPAGTVEFSSGTLALGSATLSRGVATLTAPSTGLAPGTYPVIARYMGSTTNATSASSAVSVTLNAPSLGTPLSACADITTSGTYYLATDLTSAATCFFIDADNITLNLNGHTITYGTGGGTASTPAILLADSWYTAPGYDLAKTGTTLHHGGFVVYGGSIVAAPNAAQRSTCLWVGQSDDISPAPVVHDLTLTTYAEDASPIFGTVSASGWQIYNNTVNYASLTTSSRYDLWGYAIWIADDPNDGGSPADQIYNNKIIGAPQGGIFDDHQNTYTHNNDITFNSLYANDYCVATLSGNGQTVSYNNCHPLSGRGIDAEASNETIDHNTITVTELPQDAEYGGCELAGADGIRVRDNVYQGNPAPPSGVTVSNNTINAIATTCQANGLRLTGLLSDDNVTYSNNTVTTTGVGTSLIPDYAVSMDGVQQAPLTFTSNSFSSVYAYVEVDWDGANATMDAGQTWLGAPLLALDDENGYNDQSEDGPTFAQSITISGAQSGSIHCGNYAAGPATFGLTSQTCH